MWSESLGLDAVGRDAHFVDDLDGDSIVATEIGARLNERFGLRLAVDLPFTAPTVAATTEVILAELGEPPRASATAVDVPRVASDG